MPYVDHELLKPLADDTPIWRYMDFVKFMSLLDRQSLFFCRVDNLGDPFEGSAFRNSFAKVHQVDANEHKYFTVKVDDLDDNERAALTLGRRHWTQVSFVNSWYNHSRDSSAMWVVYASLSDGIAIRSTVGDVRRGLAHSKEDVFLGRVRYVDFDLEEGNILENGILNILNKRDSFEHEHEIRAITVQGEGADPLGFYVSVDVSALVKEVVIAPQARKWFADLVRGVTLKYGLDVEVSYSPLASGSYWGEPS